MGDSSGGFQDADKSDEKSEKISGIGDVNTGSCQQTEYRSFKHTRTKIQATKNVPEIKINDNKLKTNKLPGQVNTKEKSLSGCEVLEERFGSPFMDGDDFQEVFWPRKSLQRSPELKKGRVETEKSKEKVNSSDETNRENQTPKSQRDLPPHKRKRSGSSPGSLERFKIQHWCETNDITKESTSDSSVFPPLLQGNNSENPQNMIERVLENLEIIQNYSETEIEKNKESDSQNKVILRKASYKIYKVLTTFAYQIGHLQQENAKLTYQLNHNIHLQQLSGTTNPETTSNLTPTLPQNTYSTVIKRHIMKQTGQSTQVEQEWQTPPQIKKHETLVKIKNQNNSKVVISEIKQNIKSKGVKETFKNVRELNSGGIIIECYNEEQQKKLKDMLQDSENLQVKENQISDPYIMITGIKKGYEPVDFINELVEQNPDIMTNFGQNVKSRLRYITRRTCRNPTKENWILQTNPDIFKWLIRCQNLSFDLVKIYTQEYFNIALCFKCCNFGHVMKYCTSSEVCFKCSKNHDGKECNEEVLECPNCKRLKIPDRNHTAKNWNCPAFVRKVREHQNKTNYQDVIKQNFL